MKKLFSIFIESDNTFEGEQEGERVILLLRRHSFVLFSHLAFVFVAAFLPIIIGGFFVPLLQRYNFMMLFLLLSSLFYCVLWFMTFYILMMYTLDVWIVTNRRIIDSNQVRLFNRTVSELHLSSVQDVSVKTSGIIETMLKYGNVEIQTAGTQNKFAFLQIPNPDTVKDTIMSQVGVANPHISLDTPEQN